MISPFFTHLFPPKFYRDTLKFSKTLYAGAILVALFTTLSVTGLLLMFYYSPDAASSYSSVIFLEESVFGGKFLRALHRMCSHIFLIVIAVHLLRTVLTGVYAGRKRNWKLGYIIFFVIVFEAYTGYLMPMDQLSYWATKTGMELMNTLPFGDFIKNLLMPDDVGGKLTVLRFYTLHVIVLPVFSLTLISAHLYNIRKNGGLVKYTDNSDKEDRRKLIRFSLLIGFASILFAIILTFIFPSPLDTAADPSSPPNPAKSAWFLLWIQEVVSWRAVYFNVIMLLIILFYFLPDFRKKYTPNKAVWFSKNDRAVWSTTIALTFTVIVLTIIATFFRGENWELVSFYF
ncbi:cytochrome b N-terminal domain-containing protein [Deferribacteres bacterium DY0037]